MEENQAVSIPASNAFSALGTTRDHGSSTLKVETNEKDPEAPLSTPTCSVQIYKENSDHEKTMNGSSRNTTFVRKVSTWPNSFIRAFVNWIPMVEIGRGETPSADNSGRINTLFGFITLVCVILLCIYVVSGRATETSVKRNDDRIYPRRLEPLPYIPLTLNQDPVGVYSWSSIGTVFHSSSDKTRLHIKVNHKEQVMPEYTLQPQVTMKPNENSILISGRPNYCLFSDSETPEDVIAPYTTHLNISEMADCHHYTKLILTHWKFPSLRHIKLYNTLIREQEFRALTRFIDRHNETLHRVEIDECFLCPSHICDAGLINFPDHDFQITITRRRESPGWI